MATSAGKQSYWLEQKRGEVVGTGRGWAIISNRRWRASYHFSPWGWLEFWFLAGPRCRSVSLKLHSVYCAATSNSHFLIFFKKFLHSGTELPESDLLGSVDQTGGSNISTGDWSVFFKNPRFCSGAFKIRGNIKPASGRFTDEQSTADKVYGMVGGMALRTSLV